MGGRRGREGGREEREGREGGKRGREEREGKRGKGKREGGRERGREREGGGAREKRWVIGGSWLTSITCLKEALLNGRDEALWNVHTHRLVCELQLG